MWGISLTEQQRYRLRVYARQVRLEAQQLRWQAAQVRQRAALILLTRHMPDANPITLEVASAIFRQHHLWPGAPPPTPCPINLMDTSSGGDLSARLAIG